MKPTIRTARSLFLAGLMILGATAQSGPSHDLSPPAGATPRPNGSDGLRLTLSASQPSYRSWETVRISLLITNDRPNDTDIPCLPIPYSANILVFDINGTRVPRNVPTTPAPLSFSGQRYGVHTAINGTTQCIDGADLTNWGYRLPAGVYTIRAIYYGIASFPIRSNDVEVTVIPTQTPLQNGAYGLRAILSTSRTSYRATERIAISLSVRNDRGVDTIIRCLPGPNSSVVQVFSANGSLVHDNVPSTAKPLYFDARGTYHGVSNGATYPCFDDVDLSNWGYRLSAGTYKLRLVYYNAPEGPIASNDLIIKVRK